MGPAVVRCSRAVISLVGHLKDNEAHTPPSASQAPDRLHKSYGSSLEATPHWTNLSIGVDNPFDGDDGDATEEFWGRRSLRRRRRCPVLHCYLRQID